MRVDVERAGSLELALKLWRQEAQTIRAELSRRRYHVGPMEARRRKELRARTRFKRRNRR